MAVLKCPNCGANVVDSGKLNTCVYCGSFVETKIEPAPEPKPRPNPPDTKSITFNIPDLSDIPIIGRFYDKHNSQDDEYPEDNGNQAPIDPRHDYRPAKKRRRKRLYIATFILVLIFSVLPNLINAITFNDYNDRHGINDSEPSISIISHELTSTQINSTQYEVTVTFRVQLRNYNSSLLISYDLYYEDIFIESFSFWDYKGFSSGQHTIIDTRTITTHHAPNRLGYMNII